VRALELLQQLGPDAPLLIASCTIGEELAFIRHQVLSDFSTSRLAPWILAMFRDYQRQSGNDLSSHDFRKAGVHTGGGGGHSFKAGSGRF